MVSNTYRTSCRCSHTECVRRGETISFSCVTLYCAIYGCKPHICTHTHTHASLCTQHNTIEMYENICLFGWCVRAKIDFSVEFSSMPIERNYSERSHSCVCVIEWVSDRERERGSVCAAIKSWNCLVSNHICAVLTYIGCCAIEKACECRWRVMRNDKEIRRKWRNAKAIPTQLTFSNRSPKNLFLLLLTEWAKPTPNPV